MNSPTVKSEIVKLPIAETKTATILSFWLVGTLTITISSSYLNEALLNGFVRDVSVVEAMTNRAYMGIVFVCYLLTMISLALMTVGLSHALWTKSGILNSIKYVLRDKKQNATLATYFLLSLFLILFGFSSTVMKPIAYSYILLAIVLMFLSTALRVGYKHQYAVYHLLEEDKRALAIKRADKNLVFRALSRLWSPGKLRFSLVWATLIWAIVPAALLFSPFGVPKIDLFDLTRDPFLDGLVSGISIFLGALLYAKWHEHGGLRAFIRKDKRNSIIRREEPVVKRRRKKRKSASYKRRDPKPKIKTV